MKFILIVFNVSLLFLLFSSKLTCANVYPSTTISHYRAAVVEHKPVDYSYTPVNNTRALEIMMNNLDSYEMRIKEAVTENTQIIVFPEDGLYGADLQSRSWAYPYLETIPGVMNGQPIIIPCNDPIFSNRPVLQRASCLAKNYSIVLVFDMGDKQPCTSNTSCPKDGHMQFNTQVAFSEKGQLMAKYHKSHLYYEPEWNVGVPNPVYFDTSFGVRFGLFICYDMIWPEPQRKLINKFAIRNFAFSSWWVNFPPMITGTQVQQAWARLHKVNFLASNIGTGSYNSGSGIYSYTGEALESFYNPEPYPKGSILIADVPLHQEDIYRSAPISMDDTSNFYKEVNIYKKIKSSSPSSSSSTTTSSKRTNNLNFFSLLKKERPTTVYTVKTFKATSGIHNYTISVKGETGLICNVKLDVVSTISNKHDIEVFGVVGLDDLYNGLFPVQICGLMRCISMDEKTCTKWIQNSNTKVSSFQLNGNFLPKNQVQQLSMVSTNNAQLVNNNKYIVEQNNIYSTKEWKNEVLLNAAIFGVKWSKMV